MITGIIPCAGKGSRWGEFIKPLLPCGEGKWMINRTVKAMTDGGAERIAIVCNSTNIGTIAHHMRGKHKTPIYYAVQTDERDIWGAIAAALPLVRNSHAFFGMPDTYYPENVFERFVMNDFELGVFETDKPDRFGVIANGMIVNKSSAWMVGEYTAWGTLAWSPHVTRFWEDYDDRLEIESYTHGLNLAIDTFGFSITEMDYYKDMSNWDDYREFCANA